MVENDLKLWKDGPQTYLENIKDEIKPGVSWNEVIEKAERYIVRHGNQLFPQQYSE